MADTVEKTHWTDTKHNAHQRRQRDIHKPQSFGCLTDPRTQSLVGNARHFGVKHLNTTRIIQHRQKGDCEKNDTHAANPLRQTAPNEYAV